MKIRTQDMSHWAAHTRRYKTLTQAMDAAMYDLEHIAMEWTPRISIWPMSAGWIAITYTSTLVN